MEAADITITGDDPLMIPAVIRMANKTMRIVRQNFATAIGVNSLGIVLVLGGRVAGLLGCGAAQRDHGGGGSQLLTAALSSG